MSLTGKGVRELPLLIAEPMLENKKRCKDL
jgi:hypothetical protein